MQTDDDKTELSATIDLKFLDQIAEKLRMPGRLADAECIEHARKVCQDIGQMCSTSPKMRWDLGGTTLTKKVYSIIISLHAICSCANRDYILALDPFVSMFIPTSIPARMFLSVTWKDNKDAVISKYNISAADIKEDMAAFAQMARDRPIDHWAYSPVFHLPAHCVPMPIMAARSITW